MFPVPHLLLECIFYRHETTRGRSSSFHSCFLFLPKNLFLLRLSSLLEKGLVQADSIRWLNWYGWTLLTIRELPEYSAFGRTAPLHHLDLVLIACTTLQSVVRHQLVFNAVIIPKLRVRFSSWLGMGGIEPHFALPHIYLRSKWCLA